MLGMTQTHDCVVFQADVKRFVRLCPACQKNAPFKTQPQVLRPVPPPHQPLKQWGMDLSRLPKTKEGYNYIIVAVCYLSKWPEVRALKTKEASGVLEFFDDLCTRYGFPDVLITDQG